MSHNVIDEKADIDHVESLKQPDLDHYQNAAGIVREELLVDLPETLVGLSDEQIAKLDKQITWKLDFLIVPW